MKDTRPKNLDLMAFRWPFPAITSIIHRLSGGFLFFAAAVLLYLLDTSLQSEAGFAEVVALFANPGLKFFIWVIVSALLYHLIAGVKHLLMDLGIGESKEGGFRGAITVVIVSAISIVIAGVWIW